MSERLCRSCQQPLEPNLKFCRACGSSVDALANSLSTPTTSVSSNEESVTNDNFISSQGKRINKALRYVILVGWFLTLFVAVTTTGLVAYFKVIKAPVVSATPSPTPIASPTILATPNLTTLLAEAKTQLQRGNTDVAIEKLLEVIKLDSNNAEAYKTYADALIVANRYPEAIENYQKSMDLNKGDLELYSKLGQACEQIGQDDKAITAYTTSLAIENDATLRLQLARVLVRNNRLEEARKNYDQVEKGQDLSLGNIAKQEMAKLNDERVASSKPFKTPLPLPSLRPTPTPTPTPTPEPIKRIDPIKIEPPKPIATPTAPPITATEHISRGKRLLADVKDYNGALREFEKAINLEPRNLGVYYLIGLSQYGLGNRLAALESFRRCTPPAWNGDYSNVCPGQVKKVEKELKK
ncbi:MAG: Flp pilus assembly protein TadD [bacterium]|nr:MAG: Flp pilus assembly protein TadD [bacterium]